MVALLGAQENLFLSLLGDPISYIRSLDSFWGRSGTQTLPFVSSGETYTRLVCQSENTGADPGVVRSNPLTLNANILTILFLVKKGLARLQ